MRTCQQAVDRGQRECGVTPTRHYLVGHRCVDHTPARQAGHPEPPETDPALRWKANVPALQSVSRVVDDRAIASGRRRSSPAAYADARRAEQARKDREAALRRRTPAPVADAEKPQKNAPDPQLIL